MRRKPKKLTDAPRLYRPSHGGAGLALTQRECGRPGAAPPGTPAPATTAEEAALIPLADLAAESQADASARQRAHQIARRLSLRPPPREQRPRRGVGELTSVPWSADSDELDLERTLEAMAGAPFPQQSDVFVRRRVRRHRSVALVVDVSGSMRGERVRTAAATVGALAAEFRRDRLAVVAFWSDAAVLVRLGERVSPGTVLDLLLRVPTQGLTNVSFALEVAARELAGVPRREARVLLLSDCVHNAGPDPRLVASGLPRLDVLLDTSGEHDADLGRDLARCGRGRVRLVHEHRQVAAALGAVFAG